MVGDRFPGGSVTGSVTGVGLPHLLTTSVCELGRGDVLAGRFQIEAVLGTGGSGRVLRAFDRESRTPVALKILRQELAGEPVWAERFARELRVGRAISHANVCRVFDIGEADGHRFLSMELAAGGSLRADVPKVDAWQAARRQSPPREWADRVSDARAIVAGVAALHQAGIVHRDLKPENILRMADGRLVVTDFGLATDPGSGPGMTIMVGTPSYMAPEVVMGDPATMRSDVWGLGMVLHEVFFGIRPQWKVLGRGYRRFVRPDAARTPVERAVADLCGRCADDDPQLRPPTAADVVRELERALRGKGVVARHVRQRLLWGATAVAAVAALVVVKMHYANRAEASSSQVAAEISQPVPQPTGPTADWSKGAKTLAVFPGRLHCYALVNGRKTLRTIWGSPRRAEDIDLATGARGPARLARETYQDGCPVLSPDGASLLFEKASDTGTHIFLSHSAAGDSKQLVRGSAPVWLPNGQEFVMTVDSRHVGMFSIPTGELTLVMDEDKGPRLLVDYGVNDSGDRLAVLYTNETADTLLVVHSLPGMEVLNRVRVPPSARKLLFDSNDAVSVAMNGPSGLEEMIRVDLPGGRLSRLGRIPQWDVRGTLEVDRRTFVAARQLRNDLWLKGTRVPRELTADGESFHGSLSPTGETVIQRHLADGRFVIVFRDRQGTEVQKTEGPLDATPTFLPGGNSWIYSKVDSGELLQCPVASGSCIRVHTDSLMPAFLSVDPTAHQVAYLTMMNSPRLRVVSLSGGPSRDLGPAGDKCAPIWTTDSRLWVALPAVGTQMTWAEVDTRSRLRTGKVLSVPVPNNEACGIPASLVDASPLAGRSWLSAVSRETSEIREIVPTDG